MFPIKTYSPIYIKFKKLINGAESQDRVYLWGEACGL